MDIKFGKYPNLSCIPAGIVDNIRLMIHYNPEQRPNLYELPKVKINKILKFYVKQWFFTD